MAKKSSSTRCVLKSSLQVEKNADIRVLSATTAKKNSTADISCWPDQELAKYFKKLKHAQSFQAKVGQTCFFNDAKGAAYLVVGLGEAKPKILEESIRRALATATAYAATQEMIVFRGDCFANHISAEELCHIFSETVSITTYSFDKYKTPDPKKKAQEFCLLFPGKSLSKSLEAPFKRGLDIGESINFAKDLINETPNVLRSDVYANLIKKDASQLKNGSLKIKVLDRAALKKENMRLMLSVNDGSAFEPRLVHLHYRPTKKAAKAKHIALVGKGIVFDSGGHSLKPSLSMVGMKFDMAGSATVYAAFRAAVLQDCPHELTCILAITDNAIGPKSTYPDSIVEARNGKTVEILNTDAEGRLVLADALDYACDLKPDVILDAATLTGACLVALGKEIGAILSNNDSLVAELKKSAKKQSEYVWELPIIDEFREDMKSTIADYKNIGSPMKAGTATAAAFLEFFIKDGIHWAHFDIAGVAGAQPQLPYCQKNGASGLMIRTMSDYLMNS